jgi:type I restriction-modification system DNA methylase subunit
VQKIKVYKPPLSWKAREILREKGQFWTPDWIAELMVEYVLADEGGVLFDPAVGTGAFFRAAKVISKEKGLTISFAGMEVDALVLSQSLEQGLSKEDIASVEISDFVLDPPQKNFQLL